MAMERSSKMTMCRPLMRHGAPDRASLKPAAPAPDHKTREPQPRRQLEVYEQYFENGEYLRASSPEVVQSKAIT